MRIFEIMTEGVQVVPPTLPAQDDRCRDGPGFSRPWASSEACGDTWRA